MIKKKPKFIRQEGLRRKRIGTKWRRPRGVHSKIRRRRAGKMKRPNIGYKNPARERSITILHLNELEKDKSLILSSSLGRKKRLEMLEAAKKAEIKFINVKDIGVAISKIKADIEKQKLEKKKKIEAKKKKPKKEEKKKEERAEEKKEKPEEKKEEIKEEKPEVEEKKEEPKKPKAKPKKRTKKEANK